MKYKVSEIVNYIENWAKLEYMIDWDNSGKQIFFDKEITKILIAMDVTDEVVEKAINENYNLIITHHPLFFVSVNKIVQGDNKSDLIIKLLQNEISVYSAHTTLDIAENGVNDTLAEMFELKNIEGLSICENGQYIGKYGRINQVDQTTFIKFIKEKLNVDFIKVLGREKKSISTVAICSGSGSDCIVDAINKNADVFISADLKYHDGQYAYENNLLMLDVGHYESEKVIFPKIKNKLEKEFNDIKIDIVEKTNFVVDTYK